MTNFVLVCSVLFFLLALSSLRGAFFVFIGLLPFIPGYIAIPLGVGASGAAGISLRKLLTYILLLFIVTGFARRPRFGLRTVRLLKNWQLFISSLVILFGAKLLSTLMLNEAVGIVYWIDEVAEVVVALMLAIRFLGNAEGFKTLCTVVTFALLFCELLVLIEYFLQHNLLQGVINIEVSTVGTEVLEGRTRNNTYRTMALFDNPLTLSEYVCIGGIFSFFTYKIVRLKWLSLLAMLLVVPVIYSTNSRGGMLIIIVLLAVFFYWHVSNVSRLFRIMFFAFAVIFLVCALSIAYYAISDPYVFADSTAFLMGADDEKGSTISRLLQYGSIFTVALDNPLFGYGLKNNLNLIENLGVGLDSYYLRILIESGFVGLSALVFQVLLVTKFAMSKWRALNTPFKFNEQMRVFAVLYVAYFVTYKFFLYTHFNNIYYYIVCGAFAGLSARKCQEYELPPNMPTKSSRIN